MSNSIGAPPKPDDGGRDFVMNITRKCDLCDTALEFEQDGKRLVFTAHDAAFCALATKGRIRMLTQAIESNARDHAEREGRTLRRLYHRDIEIELLRETVRNATKMIPDNSAAASLRRSIEHPDEWERRIAERMRERQDRERERLVEMQRLGMLQSLSPGALDEVLR